MSLIIYLTLADINSMISLVSKTKVFSDVDSFIIRLNLSIKTGNLLMGISVILLCGKEYSLKKISKDKL